LGNSQETRSPAERTSMPPSPRRASSESFNMPEF